MMGGERLAHGGEQEMKFLSSSNDKATWEFRLWALFVVFPWNYLTLKNQGQGCSLSKGRDSPAWFSFSCLVVNKEPGMEYQQCFQ